jgi:hypothetical protein
VTSKKILHSSYDTHSIDSTNAPKGETNQLQTTNNQLHWNQTPKLKATENKEKRQRTYENKQQSYEINNGVAKTEANLRIGSAESEMLFSLVESNHYHNLYE